MVMRCKFCGNTASINVVKWEQRGYYNIEDSNKVKKMATFECRGVELISFVPDGKFVASSTETDAIFVFELENNEWFDYDEDASAEVSLTNLIWTLSKSK